MSSRPARRRADRRVLIVDADRQANTTDAEFPFADGVELTLRHVVLDRADVAQAIRPTRISGLDLLPSSPEMAGFNEQLSLRPNRERLVAKALAPILDRYDYVVFDLNSDLNHANMACLHACTHVLVPFQPTTYNVQSLQSLEDELTVLREEYEIVSAPIVGVVVVMVDTRDGGIPRQACRWLHTHSDQTAVPVFQTMIPRRPTLEEQVGRRHWLGELRPAPRGVIDVEEAYLLLTNEVIAALEGAAAPTLMVSPEAVELQRRLRTRLLGATATVEAGAR